MTTPLVPSAESWYSNRLFLFCDYNNRKRASSPLGQDTATQRLREFSRNHCSDSGSDNLANLRSDMIRPTSLTMEYLRTGDLHRVNRLANHKYLETSARYIDKHITAERDGIVIAEIQSRILRRNRNGTLPTKRKATTAMSQSRGFMCKDPFESPMTRIGERCPQWLKVLSDDSLVVLDEARYVARLIQARDHLRAAKQDMDAGRFALVYADALQIIESEILPRFTDERLREAATLLDSLTKMPQVS
jgi:hypothetical protein